MEREDVRDLKPLIEIRDMEIDDLPAVFHLGEKVFTAEVPNLYRTWDEYEVTGLFHTESDLCLVAEDRQTGNLAGFAMGTTVSKPRSAWTYGYVVWMAVDPRYQKRRVGERLVNRLVQRMADEGVRIVMVDTDADNEAALRFFRSLGFEQPRAHVYLSMNLDELRERRRRRRDHHEAR
ncbi:MULTISPECIES: GNAT family N-acetyltransferase [Deferrisoma]